MWRRLSPLAHAVVGNTQREDLVCILPLGVAYNSVGKRHLIWDGRHVNEHLRKRKFQMETLQREGRSLFERSVFGGTCDISQDPGLPWRPRASRSSASRGRGCATALTFCPSAYPTLSSAPWLFTSVMGRSVRFIRYKGGDVIAYLDDVIFGAKSAGDALTGAQHMLHILQSFSWLIHPTKCVGTSVAVRAFTALGTLVDLATQTYSVPPATVDRILSGISALLAGPPTVGVRSVSQIKGLIAATWVSTGVATRVRTREMDRVIASRPWRLATSRRERRLSWNAPVTLTGACIAELKWWLANLVRINGCPIRASPLAGRFDSVTECDSSDTGFGAVIFIEGLSAASSSLVAALMAFSAARLSRREVARRARKGIEFAAAFPELLRSASSLLSELFCAAEVFTALAPILRGRAPQGCHGQPGVRVYHGQGCSALRYGGPGLGRVRLRRLTQ